MKVLIVDDHAIVRRGMISLLEEHFKGVKIGEAGDAREGLAAVQREDWDLAVVDISMPGRSGLELIQDVKREKPSLPILVVSSQSEDDYALRALKSGAAGYVSKQSASDILVTAVQRVLSGRRFISSALAERLAGVMAGDSAATSHETLSNRELQVLQLIASGKTIKEISSDLALSEKTVATYRSRISEKMGLSTNVELTRYAMQNGLVN
ncbi:MAG: response regulator transcription factor [Luteolibacter sp.]|uniref:response regulator transcription factor n=1 Tax=Luteolibacter sp. TaxID=1962973 RepID=UPI00326485EF